jgi:hypothetical protein
MQSFLCFLRGMSIKNCTAERRAWAVKMLNLWGATQILAAMLIALVSLPAAALIGIAGAFISGVAGGVHVADGAVYRLPRWANKVSTFIKGFKSVHCARRLTLYRPRNRSYTSAVPASQKSADSKSSNGGGEGPSSDPNLYCNPSILAFLKFPKQVYQTPSIYNSKVAPWRSNAAPAFAVCAEGGNLHV